LGVLWFVAHGMSPCREMEDLIRRGSILPSIREREYTRTDFCISRQKMVHRVGGGECMDLWREQVSIKMLNEKV